ncbi:MAG: hypothetical protein A2913_00505 [Parcubacteria group bacterium RIFCSPLOWO2_01_FULL_40_65]|nr:MAG: hypothetical protein A3D40_00995 [Parcubacteria group bacterium RIFCSPHIGHO2_02_FULL_40_12]OHB21431.1 MAG: hypothetical protein A2913_00505 [Parcubacteria group bacterium RIFCSPLOWO2_01_FULL_40_65]OHB23092.1 MAG: hypothetical protein A3I22_00070 [Parcubacteria group bacterium RIFCSPLOWO2_02_FULL_40_12]OHB23886.1 MAG: hypothetical protein A3F96_02000 [Parcubacteria group bacterium RIFCSPLOWO2_12_FULL_40_10]
MKRVSERHDAIVAVEVVLEPIEVQVPPVAVPVQVRHIQVAVAVAPDKRTRYRLCHRPLKVLTDLGAVSNSGPSGKIPYSLSTLHQVASFFRRRLSEVS